MAAWRYEISLLVLNKYFTRSLRALVKYSSTLEEKFRISARLRNILYIILDISLPFGLHFTPAFPFPLQFCDPTEMSWWLHRRRVDSFPVHFMLLSHNPNSFFFSFSYLIDAAVDPSKSIILQATSAACLSH